ncbi:calponin homology domain-containing protein DDB_G0272472-like isoform X3 [Clarias magur]|uniref:Calponin homology domain-containing protein DDB_G0272472-like isoform X3 n=1 Tax=Clarias magur TaxID=1594786 RepID=A0A8J4TQZ1_CLAMG|nr:calponin homology domain-containing protein DDB_G0272472-like isoform X3 [Clarias magur]
MEEIREVYEGEVRMETERNLMKIILPELQRNILASKTKMQEEFSRQMEEKNRELETLKEKLSDITETHNVLEEVYEKTPTEENEDVESMERVCGKVVSKEHQKNKHQLEKPQSQIPPAGGSEVNWWVERCSR